jgi:Transposase DDE domain
LPTSAFKKKLHRCQPTVEPPLPTQSGRSFTRAQPADPRSLERGVRQLLADKVSGSHLGLWLLVAEHLRLGTWDLLCGWTRQPTERVEPRLALQLVHEAALCIAGLRCRRSLPQKGFALSNGLPFLATDVAIHDLLDEHTVTEAHALQRTLGQLRRASGHYAGQVLVVDPHRLRSYTKRTTRRHRKNPSAEAIKVAQTFFALDGDTCQPVCFTTGTAARTVTQATPELLDLAAAVLGPRPHTTLVLADAEHFSTELIERVHQQTGFDLLVPLIIRKPFLERLRALPAEQFTRHWAGYATAQLPYQLSQSEAGPFPLFVQRFGEAPHDWKWNAFLCTAERDEVEALTRDYPKRWHVEEFFNKDQALGWGRAGTQNLHIRYGHMTMALLAQAVLYQLRCRLGAPLTTWDAQHLAKDLLVGLEGDVRVTPDTIVVTYYNAPNAERLRSHYEDLPKKLQDDNVNPNIPWLYDYKLDFRFR